MSFAALVCAVAANAEPAQLRPVEGRPYRYDTVETRGGGATSQRFATHRTIVFRHDESGLIAEVTLDSIERPDASSVGAMFEAANAGLLHRTIRFHLDAAGAVTRIDDAEAMWAALVDGMEQMAAPGQPGATGRSAGAQAMAAMLRTLPPERRQAMLESVIAPLVVPGAAKRAVGERAITLPARPPAPPESTLTGTESVSHAPDGTITIKVEATGAVASSTPVLPGSTAAAATPQTISTSLRNIDPQTGLLEDSHGTREVSVAGATGRRRTIIDTIITLRLAP